MAIGVRPKGRQREMFVMAGKIRALGSPFCRALNELPDEHDFDDFAKRLAASSLGRSGVGQALRPWCTSRC